MQVTQILPGFPLLALAWPSTEQLMPVQPSTLLQESMKNLLILIHESHSRGQRLPCISPSSLRVNPINGAVNIEFMDDERCEDPSASAYVDPVLRSSTALKDQESLMATDYYSVGVTLYSMCVSETMTRSPPFPSLCDIPQVNRLVLTLTQPDLPKRWHDCFVDFSKLIKDFSDSPDFAKERFGAVDATRFVPAAGDDLMGLDMKFVGNRSMRVLRDLVTGKLVIEKTLRRSHKSKVLYDELVAYGTSQHPSLPTFLGSTCALVGKASPLVCHLYFEYVPGRFIRREDILQSHQQINSIVTDYLSLQKYLYERKLFLVSGDYGDSLMITNEGRLQVLHLRGSDESHHFESVAGFAYWLVTGLDRISTAMITGIQKFDEFLETMSSLSTAQSQSALLNLMNLQGWTMNDRFADINRLSAGNWHMLYDHKREEFVMLRRFDTKEEFLHLVTIFEDVKSPSVPRMLDAFPFEWSHYISIEPIYGLPLDQLIYDLSWDQMVTIAEQMIDIVLKSVEYGQSLGYIDPSGFLFAEDTKKLTLINMETKHKRTCQDAKHPNTYLDPALCDPAQEVMTDPMAFFSVAMIISQMIKKRSPNKYSLYTSNKIVNRILFALTGPQLYERTAAVESLHHSLSQISDDDAMGFLNSDPNYNSSTFPITSYVAKGAAGSVSKAEYHGGGYVALKSYKSALPLDYAQFATENGILSFLGHPSIPAYYGSYYDEDLDTFVIVMEFIEGHTLWSRKYLQTPGTPLCGGDASDISEITRQLLEAIHYLHSQGLTHYDIHPGNVMIESGSNQVKLLDFSHASTECGDYSGCHRHAKFYVYDPSTEYDEYGKSVDYYTAAASILFVLSCGRITSSEEHAFWVQSLPDHSQRLFFNTLMDPDHQRRWTNCYEHFEDLKKWHFSRNNKTIEYFNHD